MGFLLLHYEYQRANNQYNLCERTGIRLKNQVERYTKRVSKMEEMFTKAQNRLENQWTNKINQLNSAVSSAAAANATSFEGFAGAMAGIIVGNTPISQLVNVASLGGTVTSNNTDSANQASAVSAQISAAMGQIKSTIASITAELKDADIDALKAQQDEQLQPISEKETEYQSEETTNETLTDIWQQRRDKAKERLSQDIENGVGGYGLKG